MGYIETESLKNKQNPNKPRIKATKTSENRFWPTLLHAQHASVADESMIITVPQFTLHTAVSLGADTLVWRHTLGKKSPAEQGWGSYCAGSPLCYACSPSSPSCPQALHPLGCRMAGTTHAAAFPHRLLNNMHLRFLRSFHSLTAHFFLVLNNTLLSGWTHFFIQSPTQSMLAASERPL